MVPRLLNLLTEPTVTHPDLKVAVAYALGKSTIQYVKPIVLKFRINPKIPILHVANTIPTNFQSKILYPGVMLAI